MRPKAILVSLSFAVVASLAFGATSQSDSGRITAQSTGHPVLVALPATSTSTTPIVNSPDLNAVLAKTLWDRAEAENAWNAALAANAARARRSTRRTASRSSSREARYGSGACGGDLPPCSVMQCESGGNLSAHNPSGADGKWQIMPGTWDGYGGYASPSDAPESVQDERAREIYAGGAGSRAWVCR